MKKQDKGITLIVLVITIIILLILVGISIVSLTGNGLFEKAELAKEKSTEAEIKEKVELLLSEYQIEKLKNETLILSEYLQQNIKDIEYIEDNKDEEIEITLKGYLIRIDIINGTIKNIEKSENFENKQIMNLIPPITNKSTVGDGYQISVSDYFINGETGASWCAVDGNTNTGWSTNSGDYNEHYYIIEFSEPRIIKEYELLGMYVFKTTTIPNFYLQASNDSINWINLEKELHEGNSNEVQKYNVTLENKKAYKYYRIYIPTGSGWTWGISGGVYICDFKLYGF